MSVYWPLVWACGYRLFLTAEAEIKQHPMGEPGRGALRVDFDRIDRERRGMSLRPDHVQTVGL